MAPPRRGGRAPASQRVSEDIRIRLAQLMHRELRDPRLQGVHLTRVEMSPDLSVARAYFRILPGGAEAEAAARTLQGAAGFLRRELGRTLRLRVTPELRFALDELVDEGDRVEALLAGLGRRAPETDDSDE